MFTLPFLACFVSRRATLYISCSPDVPVPRNVCFPRRRRLLSLVARSGSRDRHRFRPPRFFASTKTPKATSPRRETRTRARVTPQNNPDKRKKCARASNCYLEIVQTRTAQARAPTIRPADSSGGHPLRAPVLPSPTYPHPTLSGYFPYPPPHHHPTHPCDRTKHPDDSSARIW